MSELKVTSPEEYAGIVEKRQDAGELVSLPSGMVVRARRADMEGLALVGALPMSLVNAAMGRKDADEGAELSSEEIEEGQKTLIFMRETVRENVLEPSIVHDEAGKVVWEWRATGDTMADVITRRKVLSEDFKYLFAWITGQEGADGLDQFRNRKERRASAAQSRGKKLRAAPESTPAGVPAGS